MATLMIDSTEFTVYANVAAADAYALGSINATEFKALSTDDDKAVYLVTATRILDRQSWLEAYDTFAERSVVEDIINASIEIAFALAAGSDLQDAQNQSQKIQMLKAGSVQLEFFRGAEGTALRFPLIITELLKAYLSTTVSGALLSGGISSGTDSETVSGEDFGFNLGL